MRRPAILNSALRRPGRRHIVVAAATALTLGAAGPAWAFWTATAATSTSASAQSLGAPAAVTVGSATLNSLTITVTAGPGTGPTPSAYLIQRNGTTVPNCSSKALGAACTESGLSAGTQYTYTVSSLLGSNWVSAATTSATGATVPAAPAAPALLAADDTGSSSSDGTTKLTSLRFTGTAPAGSTVSLFDGATAFATVSPVPAGGTWQSTAATLSAGTHSITAKVTLNSLTSAASSAASIVVDTTLPTGMTGTGTETCIGNSSGNFCSGGITLGLSAGSDASGIASVTDAIDSGSATAISNSATSLLIPSTAVDGTHTVTFVTTDVAGNAATRIYTTTKSTDNTRPTATITLAGNSSHQLDNGDSVVIAFTEAGSGIDITRFCPGWNGGTVTGTLSVSNASASVLATNNDNGAAAGCAANSFTLGSISLGAAYLKSNRNYNASYSWNASSKTLTVALTSTPPGGQLNTVNFSTPAWTTTPTGLGDLVGNPIGTVTGVAGAV